MELILARALLVCPSTATRILRGTSCGPSCGHPCGDRGHLVDDRTSGCGGSAELQVCRRNVVKTLVVLGLWGIQLLPRTPSGESGIGRRRRSAQCLTGLPGRGCGGQVTGPPGSEEPAGSTGSVTSTGHSGVPPDHGLVPGPDGSPPEGPLSLIPTRALRLRWSSTGSGSQGVPVTRLVLMCGMPGAGRTTRARLLAATLPAVRMCPERVDGRAGCRPASPRGEVAAGRGPQTPRRPDPSRSHAPTSSGTSSSSRPMTTRALLDPPLV